MEIHLILLCTTTQVKLTGNLSIQSLGVLPGAARAEGRAQEDAGRLEGDEMAPVHVHDEVEHVVVPLGVR